MTIRYLRPGERIPSGEPRRYPRADGYVRLRWTVGPGPREQVETYEHRVVDGRVTDAPHVHHSNRDRGDNRQANLARLTVAEHGREHRKIDRAEAMRLYRSGWTTVQIGRTLGCSPATLSRLLRAEGVEMRHAAHNRVEIDQDRLRALHGEGLRVPAMARALGTTEQPVRRALREMGLPSPPPGRPRAC